jgi:two-component system NtrC family sensor kinase
MTSEHLKILMVEDNPDHAFLAKTCLESINGHTVTTVATFDECREALRKSPYDLILLDYHLPGEDGITILKRLKSDLATDAPVVVVTGHGHEQIAVEAMKSGAFDYVIKTKDYPSVLPDVVKSVFEKYLMFKEKQRMEQEIIFRNQELQALNAISAVVSQSLDLETVTAAAIKKIVEVLDLAVGAIYLVEHSTSQPTLRGHSGVPKAANLESAPVFKSSLQRVLESARPYQLTTVELHSLAGSTLQEIKSLAFYPLLHKDSRIGVMMLGGYRDEYFDDRMHSLISSICNQLSMSIENANLYLELNRAKNDFENVLSSSLDLIITVTAEGVVRFYNAQFTKRYSDASSSAPADFFELVPPNKVQFFRKKLQELAEGRSSTYESELLNSDGSTMPCMISQSPLKGKAEYLMVIKDISNIMNLQRRLIQAEKLSALGQMIAGVAHEMNNPLAGILGYSQLLLEEDLPANVSSDIRVILKEGKRCQRIVKNLLTFARKHKSDREPIDVNELLNSILELSAYDFKVGTVRLTKKLLQNLPRVTGDFNQLQQVFLNLISNALFALQAVTKEHKELIVQSECTEDRIRVKVTDNGPGMSPAVKARIFDPFYTTKEVGQGMGLGLSICFGIVQSHHGNLYVESELGQGATFIVELPLTVVEAAEPAAIVSEMQN